ncbi:MAG: c-type cytochrome [Croceibacterium sp.]
MMFAAKSATSLSLLLALAACGGNSEDPVDTATTETPMATDTMATPGDTMTPAETATPTETPSATPSATPTPKPSASATTAANVEPASFAQCKACHSVEPGKNGIGPSLAGIYGDKAGDVAGFDFSDAMKSSGLTWNRANLDRFITDPKAVVPGTKMGFGGLKDAAKRQEIITYLRGL